MGNDVAENMWFYPEYQEVVVFGVDFHYFKLLNALGRVRRGFSLFKAFEPIGCCFSAWWGNRKRVMFCWRKNESCPNNIPLEECW